MNEPGTTERKPRILIIEDEPDVRLIVVRMLAVAGYDTVEAGSGREGLAIVASQPPDLILLDVMMPEVSGWDVCRTLKTTPESSTIPVVMLTAKSEIKDLITGMQVGADDYITKPFTKKRLLDTVRDLLASKSVEPTGQVLGLGDAHRLRSLLSDSLTGLATVPLLVDPIREKLLVDRELGVLRVDIEKYDQIEEVYGWEVFDQVLREVAVALKDRLFALFSPGDLLAVSRAQAADFYVFLSLPGGDGPSLERLRRRASELEDWLSRRVGDRFSSQIHKKIGFYVGYARIKYNPQIRIERLLYRAMKEAALVATGREADQDRRLIEVFRELVSGGTVRTVFQPIFALPNLSVFGHEALTRGPAGTPFESPEVLFDYATRSDGVWDLEQLCLRTTAGNAKRLPGKHALFVNVETEVVQRLEQGGAKALEPLLGLGREIVLEITERAAIHDYALFRDSVQSLRDLGFRIAIDDAGSGYASLQSIAELRPDYLKISNYLVSSLDTNAIRRDVVDMLLRLAHRMKSTVIAEGIETESELNQLLELNVPLGQGYYLGRPEGL
jgi:EAL domain-containing protein (putative c-di-GMP-specific phosphodiesterase class I)/DNA-binding response OmpR family regulator